MSGIPAFYLHEVRVQALPRIDRHSRYAQKAQSLLRRTRGITRLWYQLLPSARNRRFAVCRGRRARRVFILMPQSTGANAECDDSEVDGSSDKQ